MDERTTTPQAVLLALLFTVGNAVATGRIHPSRQDVWIAMLVATAGAVLTILIYTRLMALYDGQSLFEILPGVFGKTGGKIISGLYILFFVHTAALVMYDFARFVNENILYKTPPWALVLPFCLLIAWMASLGLARICRGVSIMAHLFIFAFIVMLPLSLPGVEWGNLLPVFTSDKAVLFREAWTLYTTPLAQCVVFLCVLDNMKSPKTRRRAYLLGVLLGALIVTVNLVRIVLTVGAEAIGKLPFMDYATSQLMRTHGTIHRLELLVAGAFMITILVKLLMYFFASARGILSLFKKQKIPYLFLGLAVIVCAIVVIMDPTQEAGFPTPEIYSLYAWPFQILFPVCAWLIAEIQRKRGKLPKPPQLIQQEREDQRQKKKEKRAKQLQKQKKRRQPA